MNLLKTPKSENKNPGVPENPAILKYKKAVDRHIFVELLGLGIVGLYFGWRAFWFLTDDAFISFRYVSNSFLGFGYVWNTWPFLPVEGYTSFLWVFLLDMVWRVFGVEPPDSANVISFLFSAATMALCARIVLELPWSERLRKYRHAFVGLLLLFLVLNRTFLAWSSSGLETAMFDFFIISWVYAWVFVKPATRRAVLGGLATSLLALSRPDGLLFFAATLVIICVLALKAEDRKAALKILYCGTVPLCICVIHEAWRRSFYGEWLPNTYFAKYSAPWPEAGALYLKSFVLEYALWFPAMIGLYALARFVKLKPGLEVLKAIALERATLILVIGALFGQFAYYTFIIGGDHFEYRVYCQFLPLIFIATIWLVDRLEMKPAQALAACGLFLALSLPVQWTHWFLTKDVTGRDNTKFLFKSVAAAWPSPLSWYASAFDAAQAELIKHAVCLRHQEHKWFWLSQVSNYPNRSEGAKISSAGNPVCTFSSVGMPSWTLPYVNVLDTLGLNDYVVARNPVRKDKMRIMAHDRRPPDGYTNSYMPNVAIDPKKKMPVLKPRPVPLTDETISKLEIMWRDRIKMVNQAAQAAGERSGA